VQIGSVKTLAFVVGLFFFTSNLSGSFLPIYYKELGLSIWEMAVILLFTFIIIGLLPLILLRKVRNFERIFSFGIFFTMVFYVVLIYVRNPIVLGLAYGLSIATFWPSFNLLQFRLSESRSRARTVSLLSSVIPSLAGIFGPAVGAFIIENLGFTELFMTAVVLYLIAFILSIRVRFNPETYKFSLPKDRTFYIFFMTFIILGFSEAYWLAYPLFVHGISVTILNMGLVLASTTLFLSAVNFSVNWVSDVKRKRVSFAIIGTVLNVAWYFAIPYASSMLEIVAFSLLSDFASAFSISWFANYGDSFGKEYHASILVVMEVGLMIGRMLNLAPTYLFISKADYASYFQLLGLVLPAMIPFYIASKRKR
jgi:MFS family permease